MIQFHFIYRPATKEYVQFFYDGGTFGPHVGWTRLTNRAYPFEKKREAYQIAEVLSKMDKLITQVITIQEMGRSTIETTA